MGQLSATGQRLWPGPDPKRQRVPDHERQRMPRRAICRALMNKEG
jgi:hypothetical protein